MTKQEFKKAVESYKAGLYKKDHDHFDMIVSDLELDKEATISYSDIFRSACDTFEQSKLIYAN